MIELEDRGEVTIARMVRGKGNALSLDFMRALIDMFDELERRPTKAVVITGQGSVFCAGVDLPTLAAGGAEYVREFLPALLQGFERLAKFPKPLVAAINGHAIAGGAILVFGCDQRILARGTARMGLTEVLVGVLFPAWAMELARFATPPEHFPTLICTGRTWLPEEALVRGLVDELVDAEGLLDRACAVAEELGRIPSATFAGTKLAVRRPMLDTATRQTDLERKSIIDYWASPEVLENITQFVERTIKKRGSA